jgi:hypothetical protein
MPKAGERATHCKHGHDLTLPGARCAPRASHRGGGACRLCIVERTRAKRGSTKTGPPSHHRGDEDARLAALAAGLKRCPKCGQSKPHDGYHQASYTSDGLSSYCKACRAKDKRAAYQRDHEAVSLRRRAATFGITTDHLAALIATQGGHCAICRNPCITGRRLAVDHNHATGQVRGLLCANCNRAVGLLADSAERAQAAADYLRLWESEHGQSTQAMQSPGLSDSRL